MTFYGACLGGWVFEQGTGHGLSGISICEVILQGSRFSGGLIVMRHESHH
jgi:hypothetical protein